jgi:SRSO17 transposase
VAGDVGWMLHFWLKRGGDGIKHYQKIEWRQRARLDSMERKHDTTRQHDDIGRRRGSAEEEKGMRR